MRPDDSTATKPCTMCKRLLPLHSFGPDARASDGCQSRCRDCVNRIRKARYAESEDLRRQVSEASREWRKANPERKRAAGREWMRRKRRLFQEWIAAINAQHTCSRCGGLVEHWHHIDKASKSFDIAHGDAKPREDVLAEMEKCVPVCASCHTKIHWEDRHAQGWKWPTRGRR